MASTVKRYALLGSMVTISGSTRKTGGGGASSSPFRFFFLSGASSFFSTFFFSLSLSRTQLILLAAWPRFLITISRASVRVVNCVPKSMKSVSGSHRTGVSMPRPFTCTVRSSPSWTMRFNVSCMAQHSSISSVTASCKVSCGDRWMIFGCTVQSDLRSFMNARTEASMQELLVILTYRVTFSKHLTLPHSNVDCSTSTRGPTEFALRTSGNGTGRPWIFTYMGMRSWPGVCAVSVTVITCEAHGGTVPVHWSGSISARDLSSWGITSNLAGSDDVLCKYKLWWNGYRMKTSP
mmetsp:Transcript_45957/g.139330  ORF Transcript_45957/g.139330 Transcript_45957/m.139330 type:complete len:293 (-) Transcript_45957:79-957(-)